MGVNSRTCLSLVAPIGVCAFVFHVYGRFYYELLLFKDVLVNVHTHHTGTERPQK